MSQDVVAHVYDVANARSDAAVLHINRFFKDAVGLGGIFHTAIQVYGDEEWSFGYCERGTGVFNCPPCKNPLYTFRQSIVLGKTSCSVFTVNQILQELRREWPGRSYDLLSRNCNHFSDAFCEELGCLKLPGWVNRFANAGDAALEAAEITAVKLKQACQAASTFLTSASSSAPSNVEDTVSSANNSFFEGTWVKSIISISMKPSKSLVNLNGGGDEKSEDESESESSDSDSDSESESDDDEPNSDEDGNQQDETTGAEGHDHGN